MNETPEISPAPNYWDGESAIILRWEPGELPDVLISEDQKVRDAEWQSKQPERKKYTGPTAEDLDRKCSEMDYQNSWYR